MGLCTKKQFIAISGAMPTALRGHERLKIGGRLGNCAVPACPRKAVGMAPLPVFVQSRPMGTRCRMLHLLASALVGLGLAAHLCAADPASQPILHLTNQDFLFGELQDSADANVLRWRCPLFAQP